MGLARKIGAKLYNFGVHRYNEFQDEQAFKRQEKAAFKTAEREGRLERAKKEGRKAGLSKPAPRLRQVAHSMPTIRTDIDPFGFFEHPQHKQSKRKRRPKKVVYY